MKHVLAVVGLLAFLQPLAIGQSKVSGAKVEDEIRKIEQQWLDAAAVPDLPALRKMVADDFMGTAFGPDVLSKEDVIPPDGSTDSRMPKCSLGEASVRVYGDTAILMGKVQPEDAKAGGYRVTTVFQKQAPGWRIIAIHMSPAPAK